MIEDLFRSFTKDGGFLECFASRPEYEEIRVVDFGPGFWVYPTLRGIVLRNILEIDSRRLG